MRISDWSSDVCSSDLIGGEARYDFPLVTYIGVEFSVEVIENDAVGRAKINAGTPNAGIKTAFVADADRTLNGGFFASLRNAAEAVIGHDCSARSEEHTSELQSLMRSSYAVFCLKKKKNEQMDRTACISPTITKPQTPLRN